MGQGLFSYLSGGPGGAAGEARAYSLSRGLWLEEEERNRHSVGADPREEQMLTVKAKNSPAGDPTALGIQNLLRPGPSEASPVITPTFAATISSSSLYRWKGLDDDLLRARRCSIMERAGG